MRLIQLTILQFVYIAFGDSCPSKCLCTNNGEISCTKQNLTSKDIEMMLFPINATMLNLTENLLTYLPTNIFNNFTKLKTIDLRRNLLDYLPSNLSLEIPSLNVIYLNNNKLREIKESSFDGYDKIITLDLSGNLLENIPPSVFKKCADLLHLNLRANQIDKINDQSFATLEKLRTLSLSENKISFIPPGSFNSLKSIEVIKLDANKLEMIAEGLFSTHLIELHLASNKIVQVLPKAFHNQDFKILDLSDNYITTLSMDSFVDVYYESLVLDGNPIICDCRLNLLVDQYHRITGSCQLPSALKGLSLSNVLSHNFLNCTICSINPCQNEGKCIIQSEGDKYSCVCEPIYTGKNCETKKKLCELNPCLNNATCSDVNSTKGYICNCTFNYKGQNCKDLKVCLSNPCHNNGICIENVSHEKHRCKCQRGFEGTFCQKRAKKFPPGWIALIIVSVVVLVIIGSVLYFCKFRRQKTVISEESPLNVKPVM
uniref:Chondroadherin-like protein n=1 Tax=Hydra vulgaris TaxID=6087 RepID=T2MBW6_HYDVU